MPGTGILHSSKFHLKARLDWIGACYAVLGIEVVCLVVPLAIRCSRCLLHPGRYVSIQARFGVRVSRVVPGSSSTCPYILPSRQTLCDVPILPQLARYSCSALLSTIHIVCYTCKSNQQRRQSSRWQDKPQREYVLFVMASLVSRL